MSNKSEDNAQQLIELLRDFKEQHKKLDEQIDECIHSKVCDFNEINELKKRKLLLKDKITNITAKINPDIIA